MPVLAGAGGYDTREVIHLARAMEKAGANGLLSVTPYYNKPTQEGLYQHYRAIAESTPLPIMVYNVPGRTGVNVESRRFARLAEIPNIVGVKEASGNMSQMCEICRAVPVDFLVLSGDDALTLPVMAIGGHGIISVASNEMPAEMVQMVEAAERNDFAAARAVHARDPAADAGQLRRVESRPVKAAMAAMGLLEEIYPPADGAADPASREKIIARAQGVSACSKGARARMSGRGRGRSSNRHRRSSAGRRPIAERRARLFARLREALSAGEVRAAEPDASSPIGWRVNTWVKQGILLGFRFGDMVDASMDHGRCRSSTRTRCR